MSIIQNNYNPIAENVLPIYDKNFTDLSCYLKSESDSNRTESAIAFEPAAEELVRDYMNIVQYESEFGNVGNSETKIQTYEIQGMLSDLAELVVSKNPNQEEAEQLKTLDALWYNHREAHNFGLQDEIQAMEILLQNEIFEYEHGNSSASFSRISYYKGEIAKLYKNMI